MPAQLRLIGLRFDGEKADGFFGKKIPVEIRGGVG
jgi:hypothetical protein